MVFLKYLLKLNIKIGQKLTYLIARYEARDEISEAIETQKFDMRNIPDRLKNVIHDDGDYLSVGGQLLSEDRMLAHIQNRFMMDKRGGDAIWTYFDQMKLGGAEGLDEFLDFGSVQNFIAAEVYPVTRKGGIEQAAEVGGIKPAQSLMEAESKQATIETLAKDIMGKLDEKAPMSYIIKRTLAQLATLGAGYAVSEAVRNEN